MSPDLTRPIVDSCSLFAECHLLQDQAPHVQRSTRRPHAGLEGEVPPLAVTLFIGMQHGHPVQAVSERAPLLDLAVVLLQAQRVAPTQPSFQTARPAH